MTRRGYVPIRSSTLWTVFCLTLCSLGFSGNAHAASPLTVTTTADSGTGSLRAAITQANTDNDGDTITISATGTITVASALPKITANMIITGPGANNLTVSGANKFSVFSIDSGATVTISDLTIADGNSIQGGGIVSAGTLTVENSTISGNQAADQGGGLFNDGGTLTVTNSTVSGNTALGLDGQIGDGGGIFSNGGTSTVTNSTFSGNTASDDGSGGGICYDNGTLTVTNSTFSDNSATSGDGGGIFNDGATLTLTNSIVAGNTANTYADVDGTFTDGGGNQAGSNSSGTSTITIDLATLGYYGGPTQTMPPVTGSPALEAGIYVAGELTTDQRGVSRPSTANAVIDSGAVQISGEPPLVAAVTPNNGSTAGGTSIAITGTGLDGSSAADTSVDFGSGSAATSFTITPGTGTSLASITAISPAGTGTVNVTVTNNNGTSATSSGDQFTYFTPVAISPLASAGTLNALSGSSYSQTFAVSGGSGTYTLSHSGTLPSGLHVTTSATGWTLSGTPTATNSSTLTLTATDTTYATNTTTQNYTLTVSPPITFTQTTLPAGTVGTAYSQTLTASGGSTSSYTYSSTGLPSWLTLGSASGILSGSPVVGSFTFTVTATDGNNLTGNQRYTLTVGQGGTSVAVTSSSASNTSMVNQSVTFTASVTVPKSGGGSLPFPLSPAFSNSSTVTFTYNGGKSLGCTVSWNLATGVATCATALLPANTYTITAVFSGDTNYTTSSSAAGQTVNPATSAITATSSPSNPGVNETVTFTASVTPYDGTTALSPPFSSTTSVPLSGQVTFTDTGVTPNVVLCNNAPVSATTGQAACPIKSLAPGSHSISVAYANDGNYLASNGNVQPISIGPATTTTAVSSGSTNNTSTVNSQVTFTANLTLYSGTTPLSPPYTGVATPSGTVAFTDTSSGLTLCSAAPVSSSGAASCQTSSLTAAAAAQTITATYSGDTNYKTSSGTVAQTVNPAASATTVVSSPNPSVVANTNNVNDAVTITAQVTPTSGPVLLSGSVTFTDTNGALIPDCTNPAPVAAGMASCTTKSLGSGTHTLGAIYGNDANFTTSRGATTQAVADYTLAASPTSTVVVTQGYTNSSDLFTAQTITVAATPIAGFSGDLTLSCSVVVVTAPSGAVSPVCSTGSPTLAIPANGSPQSVTVTIDAGSGSTPVASPGTYSVSLTGVDATTGISHVTGSFIVNVRYKAAAITLVSGATTGNSSTVNFTLPAGVGIPSLQCSEVTGLTLASGVTPVALSIGCSFSPSSISSSGSIQTVPVTVTISTGGTTTAQLHNDKTTIVMAGLLGVPILALLGFMPGGRSSRKIFFRFLGIAFVALLLFQSTGCGGGSFTTPPTSSGQTPPGSYNILVQGTGSDSQIYQAVVQVNVTR